MTPVNPDPFIESIRKANEGQGRAYFIHTYGCQMNVRESEKIAGALRLMGYAPAARETDADLLLYNTCCVRERAEAKILGNLGKAKYLKEKRPNIKVALCGCMAKQSATLAILMEKHPYVDIIFGTGNRHRFPELLAMHFQTGRRIVDTIDAPASSGLPESELDAGFLTARGHRYKAGVNIMYGCDNFCSYCVVPMVRGRERSRAAEDICREARALADDGVVEVMLLGQNVNAYGKGLADGISFAELLRRVSGIAGLRRIRFMTSHPKDFSPELIGAVRDCAKVCKSVHLPLQSGSTRVLADMNRRYTQEDYLRLAERLYDAVPDIALTTDFIVGYPGETEADFAETLAVAKRVRFAGAFTFIYSKRSGTPAATREDTVPPEVTAERFGRLIETVNPFILARNRSKMGQTLPVLTEDGASARGRQTGRADDNTLVHFTGGEARPGDIVPVRVAAAQTFYVTGERV